MTSILRFLDLFLPARLRSNPSDLMRGYIMIGLIASNILASFLVLIWLLFYLELGENALVGVSFVVVSIVGHLVALMLLRKTESYVLCSNFQMVILATIIFASIQVTGGYLESPILQLMLQLPVTAFLLLGLRAGIYWLVLTLVLSVASYISAVTGYGYVQLLPGSDLLETLYVVLQFILLIMVGCALTIYETINRVLNRQLQDERNRFEHKASHDDLTGIPNRFEFFRRLQSVLDEASERNHKVAVVYLDLDEFKPVNDIHGHHMGDEALKIIATRLQKVLRLSDTTARLGGDEFGLILPGIHLPHDIEIIMPKVLDVIKEPIFINGSEVVVYGSCGVAIYPNHSRDYNALCRYADTAMYQAKEKQDSYLVYEQAMIA